MKKISFYLSFIALFVVAGCASHSKPATQQPPKKAWWDDAVQVSNRVSITKDEFSRETTYLGAVYGDNNYAGYTLGYVDSMFIRAFSGRDSKTPVFYQIYIKAIAADFRNFKSAIDSNGEALEVIVISRNRGGCLTENYGCSHETLGVTVSKEYLERHSKQGLRFKLIGRLGDQVINISGPSIEGFLMALPKQQ